MRNTVSDKSGVYKLLILFFLLQILISFLTYGFSLSFDEAMWQYIGRNWFRHGLVPYNGGIDNKSPLIFAIFGISDKISGVNFIIPRILGIICQSVGLYFVYKVAELKEGHRTGILALAIYGFSMLWRSTGGQYVSYTESYSELFIILAFYFFLNSQIRNSSFISGIFGGIAFAFRLTAGFSVFAIFISIIRLKKKEAISFCIGFVCTTLLFISGLIIVGIPIHDLILYGLIDNFNSGAVTDHSFLWHLESFFNAFFYSEMLLFLPGLIIYIIIKRKIDPILLWLLFAFIGVSLIGNYTRVHMKELLPQLALINAFVISNTIEKFSLSLNKTWTVLFICFFPKTLEPLVCLKQLLFPKTKNQLLAENLDDGVKKKIGLWIKANTNENELLLASGFSSVIQAYSERISPGVYFNVTQTKLAKERFFKDISTHYTNVIVIPPDGNYQKTVQPDIIDTINKLVRNRYNLINSISGYKIYRIK